MNKLTRRDFLGRASIYGSGISFALAAKLPLAEQAAEKSQSPQTLTEPQWRTVEAMTGQIIPSDDTPGAIEANCVNFIDKALAHEEKAALGMVRNSLDAIDRYCLSTWRKKFYSLTPEQQNAVLVTLEDNQMENWPPDNDESTQFFGFIRALTIIGFLADPKYGGNNSHVGWQLAGYPGPRHHSGGYSEAQMIGEEAISPIWKT
jgi:gluconate 2-dehydrogenase gamma chain